MIYKHDIGPVDNKHIDYLTEVAFVPPALLICL